MIQTICVFKDLCIEIADWLTDLQKFWTNVILFGLVWSFVVVVVVCPVSHKRIGITLPSQGFNYILIHPWFWSLPEKSVVGSTAVTVIIVALNTVVLISIVMQLVFCFSLMGEQASLLQHKILIISWTDA